jgi:hypothetical protein
MSIQPGRDAFAPRGDATDLDFYRQRAVWLRAQTLRDNATLKSLGIGLLLIAAFCAASIAFAATASLFPGLHSGTAAQTSAPLNR